MTILLVISQIVTRGGVSSTSASFDYIGSLQSTQEGFHGSQTIQVLVNSKHPINLQNSNLSAINIFIKKNTILKLTTLFPLC